MSDSATARAGLAPFATWDDVAAIVGRDPGDPVRVDRLLAMASAAVRAWARQTISLVEDDEVWLPSTGTALLVLAERPVVDVERVEIERSALDWRRTARGERERGGGGGGGGGEA